MADHFDGLHAPRNAPARRFPRYNRRNVFEECMTRTAFRSMLEEILSVSPGSLQDSDTRETVADWSSLVDVQIMTVIGSELALDEDPELMSFESVVELLDELERRGAFAG